MRNRKDNERGHEMFVVPCEESKDKRDEFAKTEYQVMHRLASTSVKVVYNHLTKEKILVCLVLA